MCINSSHIGNVSVSWVDVGDKVKFLFIATTRRRRALLPVPLTKDLESRLNDNPTAEDIRKIMLPARRQVKQNTMF